MILNNFSWDSKRSSTQFNVFNWQSPIPQEETPSEEQLLKQTMNKCVNSEGKIQAIGTN